MGVVVIGMVLFRADSLGAAWVILQGMLGVNILTAGGVFPRLLDPSIVLFWIAILSGITLFAPNTQELMREFSVTVDILNPECSRWPGWLAWQPTLGWAAFCTCLFLVAVFSMKGNTDFLYYKF